MRVIYYPSVAAGDPFRSNRALVLHGNSSPIIDSSPSARVVTASGSPAPIYSNAQFKFGPGSIFYPNNFNSYLTVPSSSAFALGTADFTLEAFVYHINTNLYGSLLEIGNHINSSGVIFLINGQIYSGAFFGTASSYSLNTQTHIAWVRSSGTVSFYINKVLSRTYAFANNITATGPVTIGSSNPASAPAHNFQYALNGYLDEFVLTPGIALTPDQFTFSDQLLDF